MAIYFLLSFLLFTLHRCTRATNTRKRQPFSFPPQKSDKFPNPSFFQVLTLRNGRYVYNVAFSITQVRRRWAARDGRFKISRGGVGEKNNHPHEERRFAGITCGKASCRVLITLDKFETGDSRDAGGPLVLPWLEDSRLLGTRHAVVCTVVGGIRCCRDVDWFIWWYLKSLPAGKIENRGCASIRPGNALPRIVFPDKSLFDRCCAACLLS